MEIHSAWEPSLYAATQSGSAVMRKSSTDRRDTREGQLTQTHKNGGFSEVICVFWSNKFELPMSSFGGGQLQEQLNCWYVGVANHRHTMQHINLVPRWVFVDPCFIHLCGGFSKLGTQIMVG